VDNCPKPVGMAAFFVDNPVHNVEMSHLFHINMQNTHISAFALFGKYCYIWLVQKRLRYFAIQKMEILDVRFAWLAMNVLQHTCIEFL
jgi:hypothetical protein